MNELVRVLTDGPVRDVLELDLKEPGETIRILVAYVGQGRDKLKLHYRVNHLAPETRSEILVCGVLTDEAEKELVMEIDFRRGCMGAVGEEREDALTLSEQAISKTRPMIYCAEENATGVHGASMGRLDEQAVEYLMSRGLNYQQARQLLVRAKLMQVVGKIKDTKVAAEVAKKLERALEGLVKYDYDR